MELWNNVETRGKRVEIPSDYVEISLRRGRSGRFAGDCWIGELTDAEKWGEEILAVSMCTI